MLAGIVGLQLGRVERRIRDNHGIDVTIAPEVVTYIVERCTEVASGGRMIDAVLTNTLLPEMSVALLERRMRGEEVAAIAVDIVDDRFSYTFNEPLRSIEEAAE
jgi:type VI secretion system protein VasG